MYLWTDKWSFSALWSSCWFLDTFPISILNMNLNWYLLLFVAKRHVTISRQNMIKKKINHKSDYHSFYHEMSAAWIQMIIYDILMQRTDIWYFVDIHLKGNVNDLHKFNTNYLYFRAAVVEIQWTLLLLCERKLWLVHSRGRLHFSFVTYKYAWYI